MQDKLEHKIKVFKNMSLNKDFNFISIRAEEILLDNNIKECKIDIFKKPRKRFFVDLRVGVLYIIDSKKMPKPLNKYVSWEDESDGYKKCVVLFMHSNNRYDGKMTNYLYELANLFCEILNEDEKSLPFLLKEIPNLIPIEIVLFFIDSKDSKRFKNFQLISCYYEEYIKRYNFKIGKVDCQPKRDFIAYP